jgi:hypothetical protein
VHERSATDLLTAMYSRLVDRLAVEVSAELRREGIDHVLLKGAAIAGWLYDATEVRPYGDADFLVAKADWDRAIEVLRAKGFDDALEEMAHPRMASFTSHPWYLEGSGYIDMHATLQGLTADMDTVWKELTAERDVVRLPEGELETLSEAGRLLHVALHAAQHRDGQAAVDLERALARTDDAAWTDAARLAERTGGVAAFVSGLRVLSAGRPLVKRLGLSEVWSVETLLRADQVPLAEGLLALIEAPGWRAKTRLLGRELVPTRAFMRWWSPLASRGRLGLMLAYVWRPVYFVLHAPSAARALRKARRDADRGR